MQARSKRPSTDTLTSSRSGSARHAMPLNGTPETNGQVKVVLVEACDGTSATEHPALQPWLEQGWTVQRVRTRIVEQLGLRLLVVLTRE